MSNLEIKGTTKKICDIETFASGFQKRNLVLMTEEQYPQPIQVEFLQDKISLLDNIAEGEEVKIGINIRGREWTSPQGETKYFNSITGWRLEKTSGTSDFNETTQAQDDKTNQQASAEIVTGKTKVPMATAEQAFGGEEDEDDDLPF